MLSNSAFFVSFLLVICGCSCSAFAFSSTSLFKQHVRMCADRLRQTEDSSLPESSKERTIKSVSKVIKSLVLAAPVVLSTLVRNTATAHATTDDEVPVYEDKTSGFSIALLPGWFPLPRKTPTPTMMKYQTEEVMFVANNFAEGSSLSITRCNAGRLLKDFEVEWWFAPLEKMEDVGSADLVSRLLILQRQGEFEKKETPSIATSTKIENGVLSFEFSTPLAEEVTRKTSVKCFLRGGTLLVVWVSALSSVWEGDYAPRLNSLRDSFKLIERTATVPVASKSA